MKRNMRTRKQWARVINDEWTTSAGAMIGSIIKIGKLLDEAKAELEHGEFESMVESDLKFSPATGRKCRLIADDERLTNRSIWNVLPPSWTSLYGLHCLDDETFQAMLDDGTIRSDMRGNEINKALRLSRVETDEQRVLDLVPIVGKFPTLILDPAWEYDWLSIAGRAKPGYAMQTHEQLLDLDVRAWADERGCHLYCWTTNNFMERATVLVKHWGFQHRTLITWIKPPPFGLGSYFRNSTEHVLFATLGDTTTRHAAASIPTHFEAPRGEHSEKPERFYEIVRAASYPPYGEANQRQAHEGFTSLFCPMTVDDDEAAA